MVLSKRAMYIAERDGTETYEDEFGFVEFLHKPTLKQMWLSNIYILPQHRQFKNATKYYNIVMNKAKEYKCKEVLAGFDKSTINWKLSESMVKAKGFKKIAIEDNGNYLVYSKEI